jgi:AcrR family transcriptional regulator
MNVHSFVEEGGLMKIRDKRREIMQAALKIIAKQGFHDAPMAEIATKAHVAAGTIYRYFENKDVMINEVSRELEERISTELLKGYPTEGSLRERFLHMIRGILRHFIDNPLHFRYLEQYFNSPYGISLHREMLLGKSGNRDILMEMFESGIQQQVLKELPKAVLFSLALGPMIILMRDHILGFVLLDAPLIEQITVACWDAIER